MSSSSLFLKIRNAIKFLLFKEDNPKQGTVSFECGVAMFVLLVPIVAVTVRFLMFGFEFIGFAGLIGSYIFVCLLGIEIPHVLFDR